MGTAIIASLATTALWIITHLVALHLRPAKNRMTAMGKAYLLSVPLLLAVLMILNHNKAVVLYWNGDETPLLSYLYALLLQLLFFMLFVECFYHIERSVTLRLLVEILEASNTEPIIQSIMKDYSVDDMIRRRLDDMARSGFIIRHGENWVLSTKGRNLARIMNLSCWLFQSKPQNERL